METNGDADDETKLISLLRGLMLRDFYDDKTITNERLKYDCYPDMTQEDFCYLLDKMCQLIKNMASSNMDLNQTEAFLTSQTKRREGRITDAQAKALIKFWKGQRSEIHKALVQRTDMLPTMNTASWRIDMPAQHRHSGDQKDLAPIGVVEFKTNKGLRSADNQYQCAQDVTDIFSFEIQEKDLASLLQSMDQIAAQIATAAKS